MTTFEQTQTAAINSVINNTEYGQGFRVKIIHAQETNVITGDGTIRIIQDRCSVVVLRGEQQANNRRS